MIEWKKNHSNDFMFIILCDSILHYPIDFYRVCGTNLYKYKNTKYLPCRNVFRAWSSRVVGVGYENTGAVYGSLFLRARWVRQRGLCANSEPSWG